MKLQLLPALLLLPAGAACSTPEMPPVTPENGPAAPATAQSVAAAAEPLPEPVLTPPAGCTASAPFTLQPSVPNASSPVSAVLSGNTLWVFHMGAGASLGSPELIEVTGAGTPTQKVTLHPLPAGNIGSRGALAAYQGGVIGTFVGEAGVTLFHKPARGDVKIATSPAGAVTSMGSLALAGGRALVSFGEDDWGVHFGWFDIAGMRAEGPMQKISGSVQQSAVAGAFGGMLFFSEATSDSAPLQLRARGASGAGASFALPALGGDNGSSASASGGGEGPVFVIYHAIGAATPGMMFPSSLVKIATLKDEKGNGTSVALGPGGMVPESAIQRTSWGAMAVFSGRNGAATAAFVNSDGALIGSPMPVSEDEERVRQPAVAAGDRGGYVVWNQMGSAALRVAALTCK